jgi:polyisoprenyl-phosphate glycosyltransferase
MISLSIIIPVFNNADTLPSLITKVSTLKQQLDINYECIFIDDGSSDESYKILLKKIEPMPIKWQLIKHTRNFGSFQAISTGISKSRGKYIVTFSADLQEPIELIHQMYRAMLNNEAEIVFGIRKKRNDPLTSRLFSHLFWSLYKKTIFPEAPSTGVDIFGCTKRISSILLSIKESARTPISVLLWMGYPIKYIGYNRLRRESGNSGWTIIKKVHYFADNLITFTDLPILILLFVGFTQMLIAIVMLFVIVWAKIVGVITIPGYTATISVILFFSGLHSCSLGIIGYYVWKLFENSKNRPGAIILTSKKSIK